MPNKPLEEQAMERGFPSPSEAHHDPETGMYTMRDPEKPSFDSSNLVELESGIFVQRPTEQKETRIIWADTGAGHFQYQVAETYEECIAVIDRVRANDAELIDSGWVDFTEPIFGFRIAIPVSALRNPVAIITKLEDMGQIEQQIKDYEMQRRLARIEKAKRGGASAQAASLIEKVNRRN